MGFNSGFKGLKYTISVFIVYFNVNFNILNQINCVLIGLIKDWITSECTVQL